MSDLPKNVGLLSGIFGFCAAMLLGLIRDCPVPTAAGRAALCGGVLAVLAWVGTHIALAVVRDGLRGSNRQETG